MTQFALDIDNKAMVDDLDRAEFFSSFVPMVDHMIVDKARARRYLPLDIRTKREVERMKHKVMTYKMSYISLRHSKGQKNLVPHFLRFSYNGIPASSNALVNIQAVFGQTYSILATQEIWINWRTFGY